MTFSKTITGFLFPWDINCWSVEETCISCDLLCSGLKRNMHGLHHDDKPVYMVHGTAFSIGLIHEFSHCYAWKLISNIDKNLNHVLWFKLFTISEKRIIKKISDLFTDNKLPEIVILDKINCFTSLITKVINCLK